MSKFEIHISDVRSFKSCRRKWNWSSPLRRNLEKRIPYAPFFTGRGIHHCLEYYYRDGIPLDESLTQFLAAEQETMEKAGSLWPEEHRILTEQIVLMAQMLAHYTLWAEKYKGTWSDDKIRFIDMETTFEVPLRNANGRASPKVFLAGRFDGLVQRIDDGSYWLWETKTTRSIEEMVRSLDNDEQAGAYMMAAQEVFGVPIAGVLYNMLRKKAPTKPTVLKSGLLSNAKSVDTTPYAYVAEAQAHYAPLFTDEEGVFDEKGCNELILSNHKDVIQHLLNKGHTFFARIPIRRSKQELRTLEHDLWSVSLEMSRESTPIYPAPNWINCRFCHFRAPCLMQNAGGDFEYLLEHEYQPREPWQQFDESIIPKDS